MYIPSELLLNQMQLFTYLLTYLLMYLLTYLITYLFTHLLTYLPKCANELQRKGDGFIKRRQRNGQQTTTAGDDGQTEVGD